ncbi:MAG TPA: hypothetical protein VN733_05680 [Solirubrobacterales bacterium]|nr:hypothetical protein [Solirubrobacterales bacterium]
MTREELDKKAELIQAQNRAALERAAAHTREFERLALIHTIRTEQAFRDLREAIRRR